jgi:hypothetical protein
MRLGPPIGSLLLAFVLAACGGPSRTAAARYPGAPAAFDRAGTDPRALAIADKVFAAAGGPGAWDKVKQLKWHQTVTTDGKVTFDGELAWDRWNARAHARLAQPVGVVVVGFDLYGKRSIGYLQNGDKHNLLDDDGKAKATKVARDGYNVDTALLTLPFLMFEPGTKLAYVGHANDETGKDTLDEILVSFADPARTDHDFHAYVDRETGVIQRIEVTKQGELTKAGFSLTGWVTVNGLKFPASRTNLGYSGETTALSDITISEPDDDLFIAPL